MLFQTALLFYIGSLAVQRISGQTSTTAREEWKVRLMGGDGATTGRVEISRDGTEWGTVCDDLWTEMEAQVVCRMLNFTWGTAHSNSPFGEGTGAIFLDNVQCTGSERSLAECQHNGWGINNCRHYEDAGVSCYNKNVRLQSRGRTNMGTVEIRQDSGWVQICDDDWTDVAAKVLCKELGHVDGRALSGSTLGKMRTDSVSNRAFKNFQCQGNEPNLINCTKTDINTKCDTLKRASAICYDKPLSQVNNTFSIKLVNGSNSWGEVNVRHLGVWGQVCSSGTEWNDLAASVACKEIGFKNGRAYGTVKETLKPIWITKLNCSGTETSLSQCVDRDTKWGNPVYSCRPAYALCYNQDIQIKLAGNGGYYGRVEITVDGETGTVCDKSWSTSDARVVCKSLGQGFSDGDPISESYYGPGTGPVMMDGLGCYGYEKSLLQCRNTGWKKYNGTKCAEHNNDASVICYKDVRLSRGDHSHGVVQVMDRHWSVLCGEGFDDIDAKVICKQLGFLHGRALPPGSFGTFYGRYTKPNITCTGNEKTIMNCTFDQFRGCQRDHYLGYAAVSCYNGSLTNTSTLHLKDGTTGYENRTGRVAIRRYGIWGRICTSAWDDNDADVVCKMFNHPGGVAFQQSSSGSGPYFLGNVNCLGNETSLFDCEHGGEECDSQYSTGTAGVLCYHYRKPKLRLVGGTANFGHLEIVIDREVGTICDIGWSRYDATVACKQMGFTDGEYRRGMGGPQSPFLSSMNCYGSENSIFMCRNPGWKKSIPAECSLPNRNAGVFCYNHVRISSGQNNDNTTTGRVQMYLHSKWTTVCADGFDDKDAEVVCRELGFANSKALVPGAFGSKYYSESVLNLNCFGNESSIAHCSYDEGSCPNRAYNYASVLCSKFPVDINDVKLVPPTKFPVTLLVEKYGINGTICSEGWDKNDAGVACKQLGYSGGVPFGPRYYSSRTPIWISNVQCTGSEPSINNCTKDESPTSEYCRSSRLAARVFCYRGSGFQVRLGGSDNPYSGRVEVAFNGVWGTVCDSYWSHNDARVVCRQLGFVDGVPQPRGYYGAGTGPSWLYYVRCDGTENAVWECSNSGWNVTHTSCRSHEYDAGVYCTGRVRLEPNITYGAVEIWQDEKYNRVCADEFDDVDAQVVCKTLGYQNGISICCSVFGDSDHPISINNVQCTGSENSILECAYQKRIEGCPSNKYASVACSNSASSGAYQLRLTGGGTKSVVEVKHLDVWGTICPNGFDDQDAKVICRELGYRDGFSYYQHEFTSGERKTLPWLSNLNCSGAEGYLARCGNIRWGDVRNCSKDTKAAVYCMDNATVPIRLVNGSSNGLSGRVELAIGGEWGTICGMSYWDDDDATVVCRMLNHSSGRALRYGKFGAGTGPIWIGYLRCTGNEDSLFHCPMAFNSNRFTIRSPLIIRRHGCYTHSLDAAVQCYDAVRLVDSKDVFYGRVELNVNRSFTSVCDTGFDNVAAKVTCKGLGYEYGIKQCCSALGNYSAENITVTNVVCDGTESGLDRCRYNTNARCQSGKYVSVYCSKESIEEKPSTIEIRIAEGKYYGSVEANKYGFWGPICPVDWTDKDANATCHQLGYVGGVAYRGTSKLTTPMTLGKFKCKGNESALNDCPYKKFGEDLGCSVKLKSMYSQPTAGVLCYNHADGVRFRIKDDKKSGPLEVKFNGEWGRICDRRWGDNDAKVICKQLGYIDGRAGKGDAIRSNTHVWIDYVDCDGDEDYFLQCKLQWRPDYSACDDAQVICNENVKLEKGNDESHGIVTVNIKDKWGVVCNHNWDQPDVEVTCRQLGYQNGTSVCCGAYGYMYTKGLIDNVRCTSNDKKLLECSKSTPHAPCSVDYAAVACYNNPLPTTYTLSIAGSNNYTSGSLEISFLNISGRICADGWDDNDAVVACRELGYSLGIAYKHKILFGKGTPFWTSNLECSGNEYSLADCKKTKLGSVRQCVSRFDAGVTCFSKKGVYFRMVGGTDAYGRIEASVDGKWGTICNRYFDKGDANVFCRSIGYKRGFPYFRNELQGDPNTTVYTPNLHCRGSEKSFLECPHEGWRVAMPSSSCSKHTKDTVVHCYNSVKLDKVVGLEGRHGPVLYLFNDTWRYVCDTGFNDYTARLVCRELGFDDGRSICCSAFGKSYLKPMENMTLSCKGNENTISQCITETKCSNYSTYASVVCFNETYFKDGQLKPEYTTYKIDFKDKDEDREKGVLAVKYFGIVGRISSNFWDDKEARVFCRSSGFKDGFAYSTSPSQFTIDPPILLGDFNCTGSESDLLKCPYHDRTNSGNNTIVNFASAVCINEGGFSYGLEGGETNYGRVTFTLNNIKGTICDSLWDDTDAGVFCRSKGFADGYAMGSAKYGQGTGPIWLSGLKCEGTEQFIHQCPHRGFVSDPVGNETNWRRCKSHKDDASVYCVKNDLRLSLGFNASMGAVELYKNKAWNTVCDDGFDLNTARVICRTLGFRDGKEIKGSVFGNKTSKMGNTGVHCTGSEADISKCKFSTVPFCQSKTYASVYCNNTSIVDTGFEIDVIPDADNKNIQGEVRVKIQGIWGGVCMNEWDDIEASMVCKMLGYKSGKSYLVPTKLRKKSPVLMSQLRCTGSERTIKDCVHIGLGERGSCAYSNGRAGVLCYRSNVAYKLVGNEGGDPTEGRIEINYDGVKGGVCDFLWDSRDARVFCKSLGYQDGLEILGGRFGKTQGPLWFNRVSCNGDEDSLLTCSHSGFNSTGKGSTYERLCRKRTADAAAKCYYHKIEMPDKNAIRLVGGDGTFGRVEVYLKGPNMWGTVCDDYWDDRDATVVCRQLGFAVGRHKKSAPHGRGTGPIWMDNLNCNGTEKRIQDCKHNGFNIQNCNHREDASVYCSGNATDNGNKGLVERLLSDENVAVAVTVPIIIILLCTLLGVSVYFWWRKQPKGEIKKVLVENDMNDPMPSTTGASSSEGRVTFSKLRAHFSKAKSALQNGQQETKPKGLGNPNYDQMKNDTPTTEHIKVESPGESDM